MARRKRRSSTPEFRAEAVKLVREGGKGGEGGEGVLERRIGTTREKLAEVLGKRPKARVLLESSTESEWVARCLEELGHEVVVADPNFASMYAMRSRRVKTDKRDARGAGGGVQGGSVPARAPHFGRAVDNPERFGSAHQVEAYLGLVHAPSESNSGEKQHKGRITQAGNTRVRWLLVEAGMKWLRHPRPETEPLRAWAQGIAARSGKKKAVVALARRLAGILFAMMRDGTEYRAERREAQEAAA